MKELSAAFFAHFFFFLTLSFIYFEPFCRKKMLLLIQDKVFRENPSYVKEMQIFMAK